MSKKLRSILEASQQIRQSVNPRTIEHELHMIEEAAAEKKKRDKAAGLMGAFGNALKKKISN
jgi:hypothetical protein